MKETYGYDELEDRLYVKQEEDVAPQLQAIKDVKQHWDGRGNTSMGYFVGTIPQGVILQYCQKVGVTYQEFMSNNEHIHRIMNNPDYKNFRVFEGKI